MLPDELEQIGKSNQQELESRLVILMKWEYLGVKVKMFN